MKEFLSDTFFLSSEVSKELYFDYALNLPIMDFHSTLILRISIGTSLSNLYMNSGLRATTTNGDLCAVRDTLKKYTGVPRTMRNSYAMSEHTKRRPQSPYLVTFGIKKYFGIHKPIRIPLWRFVESTNIGTDKLSR